MWGPTRARGNSDQTPLFMRQTKKLPKYTDDSANVASYENWFAQFKHKPGLDSRQEHNIYTFVHGRDYPIKVRPKFGQVSAEFKIENRNNNE